MSTSSYSQTAASLEEFRKDPTKKRKMKQSKRSFELPRLLKENFEKLYKMEKELEKRKNTNIQLSKQSHVTDFFKMLDKNRAEEKKILDLRSDLEKQLRTYGCTSYRDLTEERCHNEQEERIAEHHEDNVTIFLIKASLQASASRSKDNKRNLKSLLEEKFGTEGPGLNNLEKEELSR